MTLLWLFFGALVGSVSQPPEGGPVGIFAGMVAGMIVLPVLGVFLGLAGGRVRPTAVGVLLGLLVGGLAAGLSANGNEVQVAQMGLVGGGIVGGTFSAMLTWTRFLVKLATPRSPQPQVEGQHGI